MREASDAGEFRTIVHSAPIVPGIGYEDSLVLLGSCFAESMGAMLSERKFPTDINPFGVLYNPLSIARSLEFLTDSGDFSREDLHEHNGLWFSYNHHGSFSASEPHECLTRINDRLGTARANLRRASRLMITLGTARVHERQGVVVANRHKMPESEFTERMVGVTEITEILSKAILRARELNPQLRVLLTVSPVRHWKDGASGNQHSKALLVCAVRELVEKFDFMDYFPAFEIMLDDLRDYRFYEADMLHPNRVALDYIWKRFRAACLDPSCLAAMAEFSGLARAVAHRALHPDAPEHRAFRARHLVLARDLARKYPQLDFTREIAHFS